MTIQVNLFCLLQISLGLDTKFTLIVLTLGILSSHFHFLSPSMHYYICGLIKWVKLLVNLLLCMCNCVYIYALYYIIVYQQNVN